MTPPTHSRFHCPTKAEVSYQAPFPYALASQQSTLSYFGARASTVSLVGLTTVFILVIISLIFCYWMWRVAGAILAVPMLATLKLVCDRIESRSATSLALMHA